MKSKGFTLIELIMVIVIIGILAAIAIPRFIDLRAEARRAACLGNGASLRAAISNFYASTVLRTECTGNGCWPAACTNTVLAGYVQTFPAAPTSGTWAAAYTSGGTLAVELACPAQ